MKIQSLLVILLGYLLGSVSWAYIIGRLFGKFDVREAGDGHISAASLHKRLGLPATMLSGCLDFCMGVLAVVIARALNESQMVVMLAGFAAMLGHNWSLFLKFQGGQGASIIQGVLAVMVLRPFIIGGLLALVSQRIIKKTGVSTIVWVASVTLILLIQNLLGHESYSMLFIVYPLLLLLPMGLKRFQISHMSLNSYVTSHLQHPS